MRDLLLLLLAGSVSSNLNGELEKMAMVNGGCSACNIIVKKLDDAIQDMSLIRGWTDWTPAERAKALRKTLKDGCREIGETEIYAHVAKPQAIQSYRKWAGSRTTMGAQQTVYVDVKEIKKQGQEATEQLLSEMDRAPEHTEKVQSFCYAMVKDAATSLTVAERMEAWRVGLGRKKRRRLVDYSFVNDALCTDVLEVCPKDGGSQEAKSTGPAAAGDDDDDDEREL